MKKIKSPIKEFMGSIDRMSITKKTSLLFLIMLVGMLFIGSFAHMSLNRIKSNFDILYTKRMIPVIKLETIKDIYTINILDTIRDIESSYISPKDGENVIKLAKELVQRDWLEYKKSIEIDESDWILEIAHSWSGSDIKEGSSPKTLEEDMIDSIELKMQKINSILDEIFRLFAMSHTADAYNLLQDDLYPSANSINIYITQLISLNLEAANSGKKRTEAVYENTFEWIVVATIGTISIAALLAIVILQNIRVLHSELAFMVDEKTKELQSLNQDLEKKIAKEVESSRQKDEIMFRQSRLAAMGEMMGNIAHQWRQPLNALVLVVQSFGMKKLVGKLDDEFIDKQVQEGIRLGESMSETIDDFRNFFKPNKLEENFSIKKTILQAIELVKGYYKRENIYINLKCIKDLELRGYPNEFSQVIMNLFSNSKDILASNTNEKKHIEVIIEAQKNECKICVIDNGGGIDKAVLDRMFEPYFTTKHKSSGTGIGLYMSKEIIEQHMDGKIWAENISHKFLDDDKIYEQCACVYITIKAERKV